MDDIQSHTEKYYIVRNVKNPSHLIVMRLNAVSASRMSNTLFVGNAVGYSTQYEAEAYRDHYLSALKKLENTESPASSGYLTLNNLGYLTGEYSLLDVCFRPNGDVVLWQLHQNPLGQLTLNTIFTLNDQQREELISFLINKGR